MGLEYPGQIEFGDAGGVGQLLQGGLLLNVGQKVLLGTLHVLALGPGGKVGGGHPEQD